MIPNRAENIQITLLFIDKMVDKAIENLTAKDHMQYYVSSMHNFNYAKFTDLNLQKSGAVIKAFESLLLPQDLKIQVAQKMTFYSLFLNRKSNYDLLNTVNLNDEIRNLVKVNKTFSVDLEFIRNPFLTKQEKINVFKKHYFDEHGKPNTKASYAELALLMFDKDVYEYAYSLSDEVIHLAICERSIKK